MTTSFVEPKVDTILAEEPHLHVLARRLTRCESDANDLVQETLLRAYHARDRFREGSSPQAWTSTILRRVFLTGVSREKRRRVRTDTDTGGVLDTAPSRPATAWGGMPCGGDDARPNPCTPDDTGRAAASEPAPAPQDDPEADVVTLCEGLDETVVRALRRVPEVYRTTFLLAAVRGLSSAEIGARLRVPLGTVVSRIHRARSRLRSDLLPHRQEIGASRRNGARPGGHS